VAVFERTVMPDVPLSQRPAHCARRADAIVRMIVPSTQMEEPLPPGTKRVRLSGEKVSEGRIIAGAFETLLDERGQLKGYRRAPYAERQGEFERSIRGDLWGLLHAPEMEKPRRRLVQELEDHLRSDLVQIADDRRSRRQMVEDCQGRYREKGVTHKDIAIAAKVSLNDFYQWRTGNRRIGPRKHRRILFVVCCPIWPPPPI
jgi:hypothetical protein